MSSEWQSIPASEFCVSVRDGTHDSPKEVLSGGKNLVTSRHIKGGLLDLSTSYKISTGDYEEINKRSKVDQWDILFSMIGTVGEVLLVKEPPDFAIKNVGLFKSKDETTGKWLYYYFQSPSAKEEIYMSMRGSTQQYIPLGALRSFPIRHPQSTGEMREITNILGTLDDKIELNRKTNETLEAMAKALFKSWFVDFHPVRAKAEGRPTGLPVEISDLFPDSFEDSEVGEIPSEWSVEELGDYSLNIESGKRPKGGIDKDLSFGIPSIGAESIAPVGLFDFSKTKWVETAFAESASKGWIQNFDVALYKDGGKPGEFRPRIAIYGDGFPFERAMVNEHVFLLRSECLGQPFLYHLFNSELILDQIIQRGSSKGAQPGLNQDEVRTTLFVKPDQNLLDAFNDIVKPIIKRQLVIGRECQALSRVRDALLPELISGEIQIPDAVKFLEQVDI